jgi:NAD+ diphosphatase
LRAIDHHDLPFAFVREALDRADAVRDDADALARLWPGARVLLLEDDGRALATADGGLHAPRGAVIGGGPGTAIFMGMRGDEAWFAQRAATVGPAAATAATGRIDLRSAAAAWPEFDATVYAQARAVLYWHARHRHCGDCGGALAFERGGWLGRCAQCGSEHYPRTDQAIIVAVTDGERLLLGRQANWPPRRWSVVAGFVEPGESLEQTVAREVMEETAVRVREARYLGSQPWPFPGALMLGFIANAHPDAPVAGEELEDARWFGRDEVRAGLAADWAGEDDGGEGIVLSSPVSIARWLIERWLVEAG